ncbi:MAG: hypothetical protein AAF243_17570, partial [Cyanobacteria bacterium P01_A01_bin.137]
MRQKPKKRSGCSGWQMSFISLLISLLFLADSARAEEINLRSEHSFPTQQLNNLIGIEATESIKDALDDFSALSAKPQLVESLYLVYSDQLTGFNATDHLVSINQEDFISIGTLNYPNIDA